MIDGGKELRFGEEVLSEEGEVLTLTADEATRLHEGDPILAKKIVGSVFSPSFRASVCILVLPCGGNSTYAGPSKRVKALVPGVTCLMAGCCPASARDIGQADFVPGSSPTRENGCRTPAALGLCPSAAVIGARRSKSPWG